MIAYYIDGGAGRVLSSVPAFLKRERTDKNFVILCAGWSDILFLYPELINKTFDINQRGVFESVIDNCSEIIHLEPYFNKNYFSCAKNLYEAFDELINQTNDHSDLEFTSPSYSRLEQARVRNVLNDPSLDKNKKTVVIQPYGSSAVNDNGYIYDASNRSIPHDLYIKIVEFLSKKYNLIFFGNTALISDSDIYTFKPELSIREWGCLIKNSDYFIGCDSLGQHYSYMQNIDATVFIGTTNKQNVLGKDFFHVVENNYEGKKYYPIRLAYLDTRMCELSAVKCWEYSLDYIYKELDYIVGRINGRN